MLFRARSAVPAIAGVLALAAGHAVAQTGDAPKLGVGDSAPKLEVKEFVKGSPVTSFQKGKNYVVEFWATWCGPCRTSIPHLTELQKKHKNVTFIGVSVYEDDQAKVKPFVSEMGSKMAYCVAMDKVKPGGGRTDGLMAKTWMEAAGQGGIPTAFIVNGDGKIAWIGHPMSMEEPLDQVVAGKWDIAKAVVEHKKAILAQKKAAQQSDKMEALREKFAEASKTKDQKKIMAVIDDAIKDDPEMESQLGQAKFSLLAGGDDTDAMVAYGKHLVDGPGKSNPVILNQVAWTFVDPEAKKMPTAEMKKIALDVAKRADDLTKGKDPAIADTLGRAYFVNGDVAKALEAQERAVKYAKGTQFEQDKTITERLEQYRKAAKQ